MALQIIYPDEFIMALREKCSQAEEGIVITEQAGYKRNLLNDGECSIMLPSQMQDMNQTERQIKYRDMDSSVIVLTDEQGDATFTFSLIRQEVVGKEEIEPAEETVDSAHDDKAPMLHNKMEKLRGDMQKIWKHVVFYDTGSIRAGDIPIEWMDCKMSCIDGSLYSLLCLFQVNGQLILGNFHCSFQKYNIWKPIVLKLLPTIQEEKGQVEK